MVDEYSQIVVDRIRALCNSRGFTLYQLSMMSDIRYSTLRNLMARNTFNPKMRTLHKIAIAFGMTLAEFLDFDELNSYSFDEGSDDQDIPNT